MDKKYLKNRFEEIKNGYVGIGTDNGSGIVCVVNAGEWNQVEKSFMEYMTKAELQIAEGRKKLKEIIGSSLDCEDDEQLMSYAYEAYDAADELYSGKEFQKYWDPVEFREVVNEYDLTEEQHVLIVDGFEVGNSWFPNETK